MRHDQRNPDQPRQQYDRDLQVSAWRVPGGVVTRAPGVPENAPAWWHGDEDASQSFFTAMGVITGG